MQKYGLWYCFWHTLKLRLYYGRLKFRNITGTYKNHKLALEVADTTEKRRLGLSFRGGLNEGKGMLFVYPDLRRNIIWMMNMRFSIDVLWLDEQKRIVYMVKNAPKSSSWLDFAIYNPRPESMYVIELPVGTAKKQKIRLGNKINFRIAR